MKLIEAHLNKCLKTIKKEIPADWKGHVIGIDSWQIRMQNKGSIYASIVIYTKIFNESIYPVAFLKGRPPIYDEDLNSLISKIKGAISLRIEEEW